MSKKLTLNEFINRSNKIHDFKYKYDLITEDNFGGSHTKVDILCPHHGKFIQLAKLHMNGGGKCPKCSYSERVIKYKMSKDEFISKANKIHGDKYDYSNVNYINSHEKVCIICPIHGEFWQKPNDHLSKRGCPRCNDSHLEKVVKNMLDDKNIEYERNKHFDWMNRLELDFYIPEYNLGIECQGKQHFGLGGWSEKYDFEKQYSFDKLKHSLCFKNDINLIYYGERKYINFIEKLDLYNNNIFFDVSDLFSYMQNKK